MMRCPHCQSAQIVYSEIQMLHWIRLISRSPKRHCLSCHGKWRVRSHSTQGRFPAGLIFVGVLGALALIYGAEKLGLRMKNQSAKEIETPWAAAGISPEMVSKSAPGSMGSMSSMDKNEAMEKLKKYRNNPAALNKLDPQKRKMVERALSLTKDPSSSR